MSSHNDCNIIVNPKKRKKQNNIIIYKPQYELQTIYLNDCKNSWIKLLKLDSKTGLTIKEFEHLWTLKPKEKHMIQIAGKLITCPRYTKNYLKDYKFSGLVHHADSNLPPILQKLLDEFARTMNPNF